MWCAGGYKTDWIDASTASRFAELRTLIVYDCFPSPLSELATILLPGATFAERDGSYVNFNDRLQSFRWAVKPPVGVKSEGPLLGSCSVTQACIKLVWHSRKWHVKLHFLHLRQGKCVNSVLICV